MNANVVLAAARAGSALPESVVRQVLSAAVASERVGLCFHRVTGPGVEPFGIPQMSVPAAALEELIELFLATRRRGGERWLSVSFDDGYEDAARWLLGGARRFAEVEFLYFVCPEKAEQGAGYRWDLEDERVRRGEPAAPEGEANLERAAENARGDLRRIGRDPRYRLADLRLCRELAQLPNVRLGNHTNCHFDLTFLSDVQAREELARSARDFERLFGPADDFAIPFGTPGLEFTAAHVRMLRALGTKRIWSSERRPYAASEVVAGAVLPRFAVDGTLPPAQSALLVASASMRYRVLGPRHRFAA